MENNENKATTHQCIMKDQKPFSTDEARWDALKNRNSDADGFFYYGVKSTSVFCRPGCSSRRPLRKNVVFLESCREALNQGFRPCKRCKPGDKKADAASIKLIVDACRQIEQAETPPPLEKLAKRAGLSPSHFHRLFKKIVSVTPKQYGVTHQLQRFRDTILSGNSVTDAIYQSGFSSSSRAYEKSSRLPGMKPRELKSGGAAITIQYGLSPCFLGWVIVGATDRGVCSVEFGDSPDELPLILQRRFPKALLKKGDEEFESLICEVTAFIESPDLDVQIPLDVQGTVFQQKVWDILRQIKPGETKSYSEIAEKLGNPRAVRAVAGACASNRLAVVIPCHRVVAKDGRISGYRWGIERKKQLLKNEQRKMSQE